MRCVLRGWTRTTSSSPVVLTHLHWDHVGNRDLFPDATVLVQEDELRYAISPGRPAPRGPFWGSTAGPDACPARADPPAPANRAHVDAGAAARGPADARSALPDRPGDDGRDPLRRRDHQ